MPICPDISIKVIEDCLSCVTNNGQKIGTENNPFSGTFDGEGHTVNVQISSGSYTGLFASLDGAAVKNFKIKGTVSGTGNAVGGIVGYAGNNTVILNCITTADVTGFKYIGGIIGDTAEDESKTVLIENCLKSTF